MKKLITLLVLLISISIASCSKEEGSVDASAIAAAEASADTTSPTSPTLTINSGNSSTTSNSVSVAFSALDDTGVASFYMSESSSSQTSGFTWVDVKAATTYSGALTLDLSPTEGIKNLYVWYKDAAGNISTMAEDSIILTSSWMVNYGSNLGLEKGGEGISVDSYGNIYTAGYVIGDLNGEVYSGSSLADIFLMKHDPTGTLLWTRLLGTATDDRGAGVVVDSNDNVYVTGHTNGTLTGSTATGINVDGGAQIVVAKYDPAGTQLWLIHHGTSAVDAPRGMAIDENDNIIVNGYTQGSFPGFTLSGVYDAFVTKFGSDGSHVWTTQFGSAGTDGSWGVATDSSGNVYVTGDSDAAIVGSTGFNAGQDVFVVKLDGTSGSQLWAQHYGTTSTEQGHGVAVDDSGNIYVAGVSTALMDSGSLPINSYFGTSDMFLMKLDSTGTMLWTKQMGWSGTGPNNATNVAIDPAGNPVVGGEAFGGIDEQTYFGGLDAFVGKYSPDGAKIWSTQVGSSANEVSRGLHVDKLGNIYSTGLMDGSFDGLTLIDTGDILIIKNISGKLP